MPKLISDCRATERKHPWPMVRLGDVCEVLADGDWIESKDQAKSGIRLIQTGNIGVGEYLDKTNKSKYISESTFERLKCTEIYPGDVLISRLPEPVGRSCVLPQLKQRMITAVDCSIVRFKSYILPAFFVAYSQAFVYEAQILSYLTGSTRQRISRGNLAKIEIPLPPLSEQREIVARLERELAAVEKMKKGFEALAETAKQEFKAELKEAFEGLKRGGAEMRRLGDVCECKKGPFGSALTKSIFVPKSDSAVKVYEQKNAIRKDAKLGSYYITRQYFDSKMRSFEVKPGDIIISCAGTIGETYILPPACEQGVINQALMRVRTNPCLDKLYFIDFFGTILNAVNDSSNGSAMKNIPPFKIFKAFEIPLPSLPAQREIVARLDAAQARAEKLEAKAREGVAVCETMRKAILKEAFE